jgi:exopolysaccharide biosynthesis protein
MEYRMVNTVLNGPTSRSKKTGQAIIQTPYGESGIAHGEETFAFAISGRQLLVFEGKLALDSQTYKDENKPYSRTAVGVSQSGQHIIIVTVDGKQPGHSLGLSLNDLSTLMLEMGIYSGIELDGGGSTLMKLKYNKNFRYLNRPIHTKIPYRERPIANHIVIGPKENSGR